MSVIKKLRLGILSMLLVGLIVACSSGGEASSSAASGNSDGNEKISIGILHAMEHDSLKAVEEGFLTYLEETGYVSGENIQVEILNAQGNQSSLQTMAQKLAGENDYVLGIGTQAIQSLAAIESEKPLLFTAVTDAEAAGVVDSNEAPGGNLTGTSDFMPVATQIDLLLSADAEAERVGVIYNSSETNSQIQAAEALRVIEERGLEAVETTVTNSNDVQQNLTSIMDDIDLLYVPADNTLATTMATVGDLAVEYQVPVVAGAAAMVEEGGLATYGVDYHQLGQQTGKMAVDILENGADPASMPVQTADNLDLVVNEKMAEALEIDPETLTVPE